MVKVLKASLEVKTAVGENSIYPKKKRPDRKIGSLKEGGDLLSHRIAVPSAQTGLTSLFGMVRGEPRRYNHLNFSIPAKAGISVEYP